jgi:hypothetical protein
MSGPQHQLTGALGAGAAPGQPSNANHRIEQGSLH